MPLWVPYLYIHLAAADEIQQLNQCVFLNHFDQFLILSAIDILCQIIPFCGSCHVVIGH